MGWSRLVAVGALAAVLASTVGVAARAQWDSNPVDGFSTATNYHCGDKDHPEGAIQGDVPMADQKSGRAKQGYNCGISLVGRTTLDGSQSVDGYKRNPTGNANMAWAGTCAYVAGPSNAVAPDAPMAAPAGGGVAVVDVSDPARPRHVRTLHDPGGAATSETLSAVTTKKGKSYLVVGQYGNTLLDNSPAATSSDPAGRTFPMDLYDVTDCANPRKLGDTIQWPLNIHNLTITPDGNFVFGTQPLQAMDIRPRIANPAAAPIYLGNLDKRMQGPAIAVGPSADLDDRAPVINSATNPSYTSHEAFARQTPDGKTKLYLGGQLPTFELLSIVDVTDFLASEGAKPPLVISQESGRGHSVRYATINGVPYIVHSEESPFGAGYSCSPETANPFAGAAQPWLTNIADEAHPKLVSQMGLAINLPENCGEQLQANETDSVHYQDVDDPEDTHFVMASMWNAGIRVFDVSDPVRPTEVAYFNPGDVGGPNATVLDQAWGHVRYVKSTGEIWFATSDGGFWVVKLEKETRRALRLDPRR